MNRNNGDVGLGGFALGSAAGRAGVLMNHQADAVDARIRLETGAGQRAFGFAAEVGAALCAPSGCVGGTSVAAATGLHLRLLPERDGIVAGN